MPLIRISHATTQDADQKREVIRAVTEAYAASTSSDPAKVWVLLEEVPREAWGTGGQPLADRDARS
ncbi:tautomerase family protein [Pseudonocardia sp. MH-G8]|uniref:tautomerase family protein n=1 Tax=Pseudonocardia sp. MH-G8 TaxID=1854588 RepID=UPI000BA12A44|nr:tautomerase family protein [Pseudonocardia sp. MH-G8]OZM79289.1 4-oxalocrotonate tautomerase [Pseudonocardia sp. MH-G8]